MSQLIALLLVLLLGTPAQAAVLYFTGFEMGSYSTLGANQTDVEAFGAGSQAVSQPVRSGKFAAVSSANEIHLTTTLNTPTIACRVYVWPSQDSSPNETVRYLDSSITVGFSVFYNAGTNTIDVSSLGGFTATPGVAHLTRGQWNRLDVVYDVASGGVGKTYVNGFLDVSITHTGANNNVARVYLSGPSTTHPHFFDDVFCEDGTAQPPDGHVIARRGDVTITPIDTGFTLVNCSPIVACWSNAPITLTVNANSGSTTSAVAQTMGVGEFIFPQTVEAGCCSVPPGAQVNGAKIDAVAKTSITGSGGADGAIRYYVNGAGPTDVAQTLTAADRLYEVFLVDTLANLNLYQIGWAKATSTAAATQTVEGMWLQVDAFNFFLQELTANNDLFAVTSGGALQMK